LLVLRSGSPSWRFQRADISFTGRLTVAIVACALIAAIALALFAHPAEPFRGRWRFSGTKCGWYPRIKAA